MNIKFYTNLDNYREKIIDAFVEEYGEKWRDTITKRYDEVEIYHFITLNGIEQVLNAEIKNLNKERKKLQKNNNSESEKHFIEKQKQLQSLNKYLIAHDNVRRHIFYKYIYFFIDQNKKFLTLEDQESWTKKRDIDSLKNLNIILSFDPSEETVLDLYSVNNYDINNFKILKNGLLELFLIDTTKLDDQQLVEYIEINKKEYEKIIGKSFSETNISTSDIEKLANDRLDMIANIILDYQSHFLGYAYNLCKLYKKNHKYPATLSLNNQSTLAYYAPSIIKKKNKFIYSPYICYSPTSEFYTQNDNTFIHEVTHAINANPLKVSNNLKILTGFEQIAINDDHRPYELLNEILNDYIANKITKNLHNKGIFIWQKGNHKHSKTTFHAKMHFYVKPLYTKYKQELIEYFMTGNIEKIKNILPDSLDEMTYIAQYIKCEYENTLNKINKNYKTDYKHAYKILSKQKRKIKKIVKNYHHDIHLD